MKCPYCGNEMTKGYMKSSHPILWGTEKGAALAADGLQLGQGFWKGFWDGYFAESYYCQTCKKIITPVE